MVLNLFKFIIFFVKLIGILLLLAAPSHAAIYAYVDERGICHYTNQPGPGRYKLSQRPARSLEFPDEENESIRTHATKNRATEVEDRKQQEIQRKKSEEEQLKRQREKEKKDQIFNM